MRESNFVKQNQEKWAQFEQELSANRKDPDQLRAQLIQITDDLSYARTFYRNRSVRVYLNSLAQKIYINIYKNRKNFGQSIVHFFKEEVPSIAWQNRKVILISFLLLLFSTLIGAFSSAKDIMFARSILGDVYVDQTIENIKKGDPFGIYKHQGPIQMFISIAMNNLMVSLIVFLAGIFASYGAVVMMVRNGIMLGVFMYFFYSRGLAAEFNYTVFLHGTIEMLTLVIETTAGMLLGRGLLYPGTLSRYKAFSVYGRKGALLFLSTVPFILFAAFIESFLTRYTDMPNILRGAIIAGSLFLMVYYFVIYPYIKYRHTPEDYDKLPDLSAETDLEFQKETLYSNAQIFFKTIQILSSNFNRILKNTIFICLVFFSGLSYFYFENSIGKFKLLQIGIGDFFASFFSRNIEKFMRLYQNVSLLFNADESIPMYVISSVWIGLCFFSAIQVCKRHFKSPARNIWQTLISSLTISLVINLFMFSDKGLFVFIYILVIPLVILILLRYNFTNLQSENYTTFSQLFSGYGKMLSVLSMMMMITFFGFIFILSPLSYFVIMLMEMNVKLSDEIYTKVLQSIMTFSFMSVVTFSMVFYIIEMYFVAHVAKEISTAEGLKKGILEIGTVNKAYGIETE
ncbi:MAG: stage II sporulation protein M [bacterium]|nr:stage II sporulation protein M [bacterium]